jgi:hypothetical protein
MQQLILDFILSLLISILWVVQVNLVTLKVLDLLNWDWVMITSPLWLTVSGFIIYYTLKLLIKLMSKVLRVIGEVELD